MNESTLSRVYLVDDDDAVRDAVQMLLVSRGFQVWAFSSAEGFLEQCDPDDSGCLVLDIRMPGMSGLKLQEILGTKAIRLPIIFMTAHGDIPMAVEAVKRGASDFIEKPFEEERLLQAVGKAIRSDAEMRTRRKQSASDEARLASLSDREREVLDRVLSGAPSKAIANELEISVKTVEFHRARIMSKLNAGNLAKLFQTVLPYRMRNLQAETEAGLRADLSGHA
jgi:FixJ family two-component response regulator